MRRFAQIALLGLLGACASSKPPPRPLDLPFTAVFPGTFETVWNATVRVLDIYSITVATRESGLLQTEWSDYRFNRELFEHPDREEILEEVRYRLKIKLSKGVIPQTGGPAVRVQITKELSKYGNIFTDWERKATDQIEENVLLYRIRQRIRIADAVKRKSLGSKATSTN